MNITRREFLRKTAGLAALTAAQSARSMFGAEPLSGRARPNVLVIFTDQEREMTEDRQCMTLPNRERLEAQGVRFTNHFCVTPQCSPIRSTLMTGLYPHQTGVMTNTDKSVFGQPLPPTLPCVGRVFAEAGYRTGYFGKWHLGSLQGGLDKYGFPGYERGGDKLLPEQARKFFQSADDRPWMLWLSVLNPHDIYAPGKYPELQKIRPGVQLPRTWQEVRGADSPIGLKQEGRQPAQPETKEESLLTYRSFYAGLMEIIDGQLGEVMQALQESKQDQNTIIVYLSDHGDMGGAHNLRFKGAFPYEEVLHIPLVIRWPGHLPENESRSALASQVDLVPTLCDLAGVKWPTELPGQSLAPLIRDPNAKGRGFILAEYLFQNGKAEPYRLIRTGQHKLCEYLAGGAMLFDLKADPDEANNLAGKPEAAEVQRDLHQRIFEWRKTTADPYLDPEKMKWALAQRPQGKAARGKGKKVGAED